MRSERAAPASTQGGGILPPSPQPQPEEQGGAEGGCPQGGRMVEALAVTVKKALLMRLLVLLWLSWGLFEVLAYLVVGPADRWALAS